MRRWRSSQSSRVSTTIFSEYSSACLPDQLGLALGPLDAALGLGARARGDLVSRLVGPLKDARGLLADLRERPLHDGLLRLPALQLLDELCDLLHEGIHRGAVIPPHNHGKAAFGDLIGRAASEAGGTELGCVEVGHGSYIPSKRTFDYLRPPAGRNRPVWRARGIPSEAGTNMCSSQSESASA